MEEYLSLYRTYEELKLEILELCFAIRVCLYRTYEELKLRKRENQSCRTFGFVSYL